MTVDYTQLLATVLTAILAAFLPLLHIQISKTQRSLRAQYETQTTVAQRELIESIVRAGVLAREQSGLATQLKITGSQKFQAAVAYIQHELDAHGLKVDFQTIAGLIEARVLKEFNLGKVAK